MKDQTLEQTKRFREQQQKRHIEIAKKQLDRWTDFKERR